MATEFGKNLFARMKASKQFQNASRDQARTGFDAARAGVPGSTPLSEFQSTKNTRYARDVIGWDKAQDLRQKAEAADVGAQPPPGRFDRRYNYSTGEMEWVEKDPSNFWKANKDELIQMGGFLAGSLIGLPMLGASLAKTGRDIKKSRDARRDLRDARRDWEYQQGQQAILDAPQGANLFRSVGEGVADWKTEDVDRHKRKDTYVRSAT